MDIKRFINFCKKKDISKSSPYTKDFFKNQPYIIGEFTYGEPNVYFKTENSNLIIGKYCSIAGNVTIFLGGNHPLDWVSTYPFSSDYFEKDFPFFNHISDCNISKGDVIIGNDVWIGYGSLILSGVSISNGAVIAAGSVVSKNIGAYEIWGGNPARLIKKRFSDAQIAQLEKIEWWDWPIERINKLSKEFCSTNIDQFIKESLQENN
jgi:acetyltransferase-like isoleucine patch superfamily enzyme